jgi:hypothetical protein
VCVCGGAGFVGFSSCCVLKYNFIVCVVHSILSHGMCFNYVIHESMLFIAYGVLYIYIYIYIQGGWKVSRH